MNAAARWISVLAHPFAMVGLMVGVAAARRGAPQETLRAVALWIKVSLHPAFAAFAATTLVLLGSAVGWIVVAALPILAWSRLALGCHRPTELALGAAIGALSGVLLYVA